MKTKPEQESSQIIIAKLELGYLKVTVENMPDSTLIVHRLDPKTVEKFTDKEFGRKSTRELRNLDDEYNKCFHYTKDKKYGFPASGFFGAMLDAAVACDIPKTELKRAVRIIGDIYEIKYKKLNRRIDNPRRAGINSTPDERHRPEFVDWEIEILIQYDKNLISAEQIINLLNRAGFSSGLGDWRPSAPKSGTHGMFRVKASK